MRTAILLVVVLLMAAAAIAQTPGQAPLNRAYDALKLRHYPEAVANFEQAIQLDPQRAATHIDLAYTLLKTGENEAARDQFAAAMRLAPNDLHAPLEYAFLCYETKQQAAARRIFDRVRKTGDPTAEQAFQNIDRPLAEGIARWTKALELSPDNFSAHRELASLAEQRDELTLAAEHYQQAFRLRPAERELLLDLGRVWKALGRTGDSFIVLLAASRGAQPRVAEKARELMPTRYPYVYEFEKALALDPNNFNLRREYAYLLLEMGNRDAAERQFTIIHQAAPDDLVSAAQLGLLLLSRRQAEAAQPLFDQVLKGGNEELADRVRTALKIPQTLRRHDETPRNRVSQEAKALAAKSLQAGYLNDAIKYLNIAHESDPVDFWVMLKLGWAYNILHQDNEAIRWFNLARQSQDETISDEAKQAYDNLRPGLERFRTTAWVNPFFSSRWKDAFGYGQIKTEVKLGDLPFRFYASTRFIGDVKQSTGPTFAPQFLSETSFILGLGVSTRTYRGVTGWFEAGEAIKYLGGRKDVGAMIPDYRGGLSYAKGFGHLLNGGHGWFSETNDDMVFVSRFQDDLLFYSQNRSGYTFAQSETAGFQPQIFWSANITADQKRQYWANFAETGPGIRFRSQLLPKSMLFSIAFLRGAYLTNAGNPRRPNYFDLRAGVWYAFTH